MEEVNQKTGKHLINALEDSVLDNLLGLVSCNHCIQVIPECNSVVRKDYTSIRENGKVLLISGGGSGHEPMFAGFVGSGLLTAAIAGEIFASPPAGKIQRLIEIIGQKSEENAGGGILLILANYTGDCLNYGLACERAQVSGYNVDMFVFGEDVAFYGEGKRTGRRGLAGISFIHKIAGTLAQEGHSLGYIKSKLTEIADSIGTISISLTACNIPGRGASFAIGSDEIELGLGVHGEAGSARLKLCSAKRIVEIMLQKLVLESSPINKYLKENQNKVAVLINNLGGLSQFEFNIITKEAVQQLESLGFVIERIYCGPFMTSFDMAGVSITVMAANENILNLLDSPCSSPVWNQNQFISRKLNTREMILTKSTKRSDEIIDYDSIDGLKFGRKIFIEAVSHACRSLISSESFLNELDGEGGDSDCGSTFATTSKYILKVIEDGKFSPSFFQLTHLVEHIMGGTSGAIYSLLFTSASKTVRKLQSDNMQSYNYLKFWTEVLENGINTVSKYSYAQPGDRSMLDSLHAAYLALQKSSNDSDGGKIANLVAKSSKAAAESTATMSANVGRASYVNAGRLTKPDPGAIAVSIWLNAIAETLQQLD